MDMIGEFRQACVSIDEIFAKADRMRRSETKPLESIDFVNGFEQLHELMLPVNTPVTFHVTSLDVIHSFWAYQLGVKADANPQVDNVAYVTPKTLGSVTVRCNELCGIWHGAMFNYGHVVSPTAFQSWASGVQSKEQGDGVLAALPPYALTYDPTVVPQLGKNLPKIDGITGAAGYYYPPSDPVTP